MQNKFTIDNISITGNKIQYKYTVSGEWREAFHLDEEFFVEYDMDISSVPLSVAVLPLISDILPIAWVYDAEIITPCCDETFYNCIEDIKQGYRKMYPTVKFLGKITAEEIAKNHYETKDKTLAFFTGGVDAFNTLVNHANEKPTLVTLWGADIRLSAESSWNIIKHHIQSIAKDFEVDSTTIKTSFRQILNEGFLSNKIAFTNDNWYHGFQHGIAIICHAAPLAFVRKAKNIYIASSYTASDVYVCASDPTIDNNVRFCDTKVTHDGYEFTRQDKIRNIINYQRATNSNIKLRCCWNQNIAYNCCKCEKCIRTILGIYAEKANPKDYGFEYEQASFSELCKWIKKHNYILKDTNFYKAIIDRLSENYTYEQIEPNLRWLYKADYKHLGEVTLTLKYYWKVRAFLGALKYKLLHGRNHQ